MKVSMNPKLVVESPEDKSYPNAPAQEMGKSSGKKDTYKAADDNEQTDGVDEASAAWDEFCAYVDSMQTGASTGDWDNYIIPDLMTIVNDATNMDISDKAAFYDTLEQKYRDLMKKLQNSVKILKETLPNLPEATQAMVEEDVIAKRENDIIKIKETIIPQIQALKAAIVDIYDQELSLLKEYGKKYYEWYTNYMVGNAKFAEKMEGSDLHKLMMAADLDNNGFYGDPATSKFARVDRDFTEDGKTFKIFDIINIDTGMPVLYNAAGEYQGVSSVVDTAFRWDLGQNLSIVDSASLPTDIDSDAVFQLETDAQYCADNNTTTGAPISISIPEYLMIDNQTKGLCAFSMEKIDGKDHIVQKAPEGYTDFALKRIVSVRMLEVDSLVAPADSDKHDFVFVLEGEKGEELGRIRVTGKDFNGDIISASDRLVCINGGLEGDPYKRVTGLSIDASDVSGSAKYDIAKCKTKLIDEFGIPFDFMTAGDAEADEFKSRLLQVPTTGNVGIAVEGIKSVSCRGSDGDDIFLLEEPPAEDMERIFNYTYEHSAALGGHTIEANGGYNVVLTKGGNFYGNNIGFMWGKEGTHKYDVFLTTIEEFRSTNAKCYINLKNDGRVEIGNAFEMKALSGTVDASGGDIYGWGLNAAGDDVVDMSAPNPGPGVKAFKDTAADDVYHVESGDFAFANYFEPEVWDYETSNGNFKYRNGFSSPGPFKITGTDQSAAMISENFKNQDIASIDDIANIMVQDQFEAHLQALKDVGVKTDEFDKMLGYDPSQLNFGAYGETINQIENFFGGWESWTGNFKGTQDEIDKSFNKDEE